MASAVSGLTGKFPSFRQDGLDLNGWCNIHKPRTHRPHFFDKNEFLRVIIFIIYVLSLPEKLVVLFI